MSELLPLAALVVVLVALPAVAAADERVSVLGDSWCAGLEWAAPADRVRLDLHCEGGTTSRDWVHRVRGLELERVVYIQLGANDYIKWQFFGERRWGGPLHPTRVAKRLRRMARYLRRRGHEVWFLGYNPRGEWSGAAAAQTRYCYTRPEVIDPRVDPYHPTPASFARRAAWLLSEGCHRN